VNVLPFEGRTHRDVERLLPWYVNATLDATESDLVRAHLGECTQCRAEVASLRALQDAGSVDEPHEYDAHAIDRDWSRLRNRLHAQQRIAARSPVQRVRSGWRLSAPWMRVALAAQVGVVAVLAVLVFRGQGDNASNDNHTYRTLSSPAAPAATGDTLLVVFDPRLTDAQMRELLGANHARIVDGPNTAGAFLVATPPGQSELVRNALRASPGVAMAESMAPPPTAPPRER
jgi:hypothetical protein